MSLYIILSLFLIYDKAECVDGENKKGRKTCVLRPYIKCNYILHL